MKEQLSEISSLIKPALELRGLTFGNKIDELLQGGLSPKTITFLYGKDTGILINTLCGNAIRIFHGRALFIDAANSFDPYLIAEQCAPKKSEQYLRKFMESITVYRAFTCYQLKRIVTREIEKQIIANDSARSRERITSIFVTGVDCNFEEQTNTKAEIDLLQLVMILALEKIARSKTNGVQFIVASSNAYSERFISRSDVAIKLFDESNVKKAMLTKHCARMFASIDI